MKRLALLLFTLCCSVSAWAVVVESLYEAGIEVVDKTEAARKEAVTLAFRQVLVKVSGRQDLPASLSNAAQSMLASVGYTRTDQGQLMLAAVFNQPQVDQLLQAAGYPVWSNNRPSILFWVGKGSGSGRALVADGDAGFYPQFRQALDRFGLPVVWPVLDLEDNMALPVYKLFGLFRDDIDQASLRYATDAVSALRVEPVATGWHVSGYLALGAQSMPVDITATTLEAVAADTAAHLAGILVNRFAVLSAPEVTGDGTLLRIEGVDSYADCQQLLSRLQKTAGVSSVRLLSVSHDVVQIRLQLTTSWNHVKANLSLINRLSWQAESDSYRWL